MHASAKESAIANLLPRHHVVMLLTNDYKPDQRVRREARSLVRAGLKVTVLCMSRVGAASDEPCIDKGVDVVNVAVGPVRSGSIRSVAAALAKFGREAVANVRRWHKNEPLLAIHCHDFDAMLIGAYLQWRLALPVVYDMHDWYPSYFGSFAMQRLVAWCDKALVRRADHWIVVNEAFRAFAGDKDPAVVMNVPMVETSGASATRDVGLFYSGNLNALRDMRYALAVLQSSGLPVEFAGDGPLLQTYRALAGSIRLPGRIDPAMVEEKTQNCFAVLALYDTRYRNNKLASPNKIFEAMKYGKPSVVSAGTVMADIVVENDCGVVVPYGDAAALERAITELKDPSVYARLAANARRAHTEKYNWEVMEGRLLGIYAALQHR